MKLLIATGNPAKIVMFKNLLSDFDGIEFLTLTDFPAVEEPIENGKTTEENALIKAKYYSEKFNIATLADDAGFEIEDLNGEPGVMARRWGGELSDSISDEDFLEFLLNKIKDIDKNILPACFPFSRCLYLPNKKYFFQNERIKIYLTKNPRIPHKKGWPVTSLQILEDGRHYMDIPDDDPIILERFKKCGLIKLLGNMI